MDIGVPELLIILVIVIVLFGPGRFGKILGEVGTGIRSFKDGLDGSDDKKVPEIKPAELVETKTEDSPADGK